MNDRGNEPVPNGRVRVQLMLKSGGTEHIADPWRGDSFGTIYNP